MRYRGREGGRDGGTYLDEHSRLVVGIGGECLALLRGHGGVSLDERRHDPAGRLEAQGQRRHVQQQQVRELLALVVPRQNGRLHRGAVGYSLVGVDALAGLLAVEEVDEHRLHLGDASRPAHQHHLVHLQTRMEEWREPEGVLRECEWITMDGVKGREQ